MVIFIYNDIGLLKEVSGGLHVEGWRGGGTACSRLWCACGGRRADELKSGWCTCGGRRWRGSRRVDSVHKRNVSSSFNCPPYN